jgi:hypothetical protein
VQYLPHTPLDSHLGSRRAAHLRSQQIPLVSRLANRLEGHRGSQLDNHPQGLLAVQAPSHPHVLLHSPHHDPAHFLRLSQLVVQVLVLRASRALILLANQALGLQTNQAANHLLDPVHSLLEDLLVDQLCSPLADHPVNHPGSPQANPAAALQCSLPPNLPAILLRNRHRILRANQLGNHLVSRALDRVVSQPARRRRNRPANQVDNLQHSLHRVLRANRVLSHLDSQAVSLLRSPVVNQAANLPVGPVDSLQRNRRGSHRLNQAANPAGSRHPSLQGVHQVSRPHNLPVSPLLSLLDSQVANPALFQPANPPPSQVCSHPANPPHSRQLEDSLDDKTVAPKSEDQRILDELQEKKLELVAELKRLELAAASNLQSKQSNKADSIAATALSYEFKPDPSGLLGLRVSAADPEIQIVNIIAFDTEGGNLEGSDVVVFSPLALGNSAVMTLKPIKNQNFELQIQVLDRLQFRILFVCLHRMVLFRHTSRLG